MPRRHRRQDRALAAARRLSNKLFRSPSPRPSAPSPTARSPSKPAHAPCSGVDIPRFCSSPCCSRLGTWAGTACTVDRRVEPGYLPGPRNARTGRRMGGARCRTRPRGQAVSVGDVDGKVKVAPAQLAAGVRSGGVCGSPNGTRLVDEAGVRDEPLERRRALRDSSAGLQRAGRVVAQCPILDSTGRQLLGELLAQAPARRS